MNESATVTAFTLWTRPNRKHPWRAIGTFLTSQAATNAMSDLRRSGEFITLEGDEHPDAKRVRQSDVHKS